MSVQPANPREVAVHLHREPASRAKRRIVTGRLRRRFGFGVSNTDHRERLMLHRQEVIVTRDRFGPAVAHGRPQESLTEKQAQ
jgi:hypothetical protein